LFILIIRYIFIIFYQVNKQIILGDIVIAWNYDEFCFNCENVAKLFSSLSSSSAEVAAAATTAAAAAVAAAFSSSVE